MNNTHPKISSIPNAGPNGETLYAISPLLSKGMGVLVERDAPDEAHEDAKRRLLLRYKHERPLAKLLNTFGL